MSDQAKEPQVVADEGKELQVVGAEAAQARPGGVNAEYNELIETAIKSGVKISTEKVMHIWKVANRYDIPGLIHDILWVEQGTDKAGYQHMLKHKEEFEVLGVEETKLIEVAQAATSVGKRGGLQGKSPGRPIFGLFFYEKPMAVAISVGSNGFVVGMNVSNFQKFLESIPSSDADELQDLHTWPQASRNE